MIRLAALLVAAFLATSVQAQDFPSLHRVTGVSASDVLNIRAEPSARAALLGSFAPGAAGIEVIGLSEDRGWGLVRTNEGVGWSSMRFLSREVPGSWRDGQQSLNCHGTEPFWSMNFFLPDNRAEFLSPDSGGFEVRTDAPFLPSTFGPPTLALPFQGAREGFAVVRNGVCSDGMSDLLFGLEVQVYFRNDIRGISGCCSLSH